MSLSGIGHSVTGEPVNAERSLDQTIGVRPDVFTDNEPGSPGQVTEED